MKRSLLVLPALLALAVTWPNAAANEPPPRLVDEPWVVTGVSKDGRTLRLFARRGGCDPVPTARVTETSESVTIEVSHVAPTGPGACPAIAIYEQLRVRLAAPIAGRPLVGQSLREAPVGPPRRAPRLRGLAPADALFALRAHGFIPRCPELRTVAKGDGSSSSRRRRAGLVVRGERRWKRLWRDLTGDSDPLPRVDFGREMLLVAVQGRQPSGGHSVRITDVAGDGHGRLVADVREVSPGDRCVNTGALTSPYHVVRIARDDRPVEFVRRQRARDC